MEFIARVLGGGALAVLFVFLVPLLSALLVYHLLYGALLRLWWWRKHGQYGRDFLVVYSDSPKWGDVVAERILPILGARAVIANVSKDSSWRSSRSLERRVHRHWGGRVEHTPIVIKVSQFGKVVLVRFFEAFMLNAKKGDSSKLDERLAALCGLVQSSIS